MTGTPTARAMRGDPQWSTGYVLLSGLAWGVIVTTFESLTQPPLEFGLPDYFAFYSRILLHYGTGGLMMAWLTARVGSHERSYPKWIAAVPTLVAAVAVAVLIDRLSVWYAPPLWSSEVMAMGAPPLPDVAAHLAWNFTVYGGLYVLTVFFLQNEAQTRERLRLSELASVRADARMERALSEDTSAAIAPDLLLRALSELAQRYDQNHARADRLLDKLVQLLRSVSSAASKSRRGRESDLAGSLGQLRRELEVPGGNVAKQEGRS